MTDTMRFTIGAEASCSDGVCGEVSRVVVDPVAQSVTHLVVDPKHRGLLGRLVPIGLVDAEGEAIRIRCTKAEFDRFDAAEETKFLPGTAGYADYGAGQVLYQPYYGLGMGGLGMGVGAGMGGLGGELFPQTITYETVPLGEVAVRRGEQVRATDGDIGRVQGLVIDPRSHHVTHVLLEEGHLWGKKEVAIPISAVIGVDDGIRLNIAKDEVKELPSVDIDHPSE